MLFLALFFSFNIVFALPQGFVYLSNIEPRIQQSSRYYTKENFTGRKVQGYQQNTIILTKKAALALKKVNSSLQKQGFVLVVYDGYRPQMAVEDFLSWAKTKEESKKALYFPHITKKEIFERGFVAAKSSHSRGSTVDVTIIKTGTSVCDVKQVKRGDVIFLDDCTEDMGMHWDFFGTESRAQSPAVEAKYNQKRQSLINAMEAEGFKVADGEWWHFTLKEEPFPNTYFNFIIK